MIGLFAWMALEMSAFADDGTTVPVNVALVSPVELFPLKGTSVLGVSANLDLRTEPHGHGRRGRPDQL